MTFPSRSLTSEGLNAGSLLHRTLVWGGLAALTAGVYLALVPGTAELAGWSSRAHLPLSVVATGVVALSFGPVKDRVHRLASRLVYGHRQSPLEAMAEFSRRLGGAVTLEEALPDIARILSESTGSEAAVVWLRVGTGLVDAASWPPTSESRRVPVNLVGEQVPALPEADLSVPVVESGEVLGALTIAKGGEPLTGTERELVKDLASQAALVFRNARLSAELEASLEETTALADQLRRSRRRIVETQDAERRKIERDLHDEAQQYILALLIQLERGRLVGRHPEKLIDVLPELKRLYAEVREVLSRLSRGLSAPGLGDEGLVPTLSDHIGRLGLPVELEADGEVGRLPREVEEAVYYVCLEAVQNALKHAEASRISLVIREEDGELHFSIKDDGTGFEASRVEGGSGLEGMVLRLEDHGGTLRVTSGPGQGTRVEGAVPLAEWEGASA